MYYIFTPSPQRHFLCYFWWGHVPYWLAPCAQKPKVPGSNPTASYVLRKLSPVIARLMSKCLRSGRKWWWAVKETSSPFSHSPANREWSLKERPERKKTKFWTLKACSKKFNFMDDITEFVWFILAHARLISVINAALRSYQQILTEVAWVLTASWFYSLSISTQFQKQLKRFIVFQFPRAVFSK